MFVLLNSCSDNNSLFMANFYCIVPISPSYKRMYLALVFLSLEIEMVDGVLTGLSFKRLLTGMRDDCYRVLKPCDVMFVYFMQHAG